MPRPFWRNSASCRQEKCASTCAMAIVHAGLDDEQAFSTRDITLPERSHLACASEA